MKIKALIAAVAVGSLSVGGVALAQETSAQNWDPAARTHYEATVLAEGDQLDTPAPTPAQENVAATVEDSTATAPTVTNQVIASAPVPDTPANRAKFGQPLSRAGRMTAPRGN